MSIIIDLFRIDRNGETGPDDSTGQKHKGKFLPSLNPSHRGREDYRD